MASWRDTASPNAQDELDLLVDAVVPFAQEMLAEHGEFYPYAALVDGSGALELVAAETEDDYPDSAAVLTLLLDQLAGRASALRATAVVAAGRVETGDVIRVQHGHRTGPALTVLIPYTGGGAAGGAPVELGEPWAVAGPTQVWPAPAD